MPAMYAKRRGLAPIRSPASHALAHRCAVSAVNGRPATRMPSGRGRRHSNDPPHPRADFEGRPERTERTPERPARAPRPRGAPEAGMETYRIAVGSAHDVKPGNIVGAIANEAGLDSENIGRVDIHED